MKGDRKKGRKAEPPAPRFHRDMNVAEAVDAHPGVQPILTEYGLPCHRCIVAWSETLAEGCIPLALDVDAIVARLNALPAEPAEES